MSRFPACLFAVALACATPALHAAAPARAPAAAFPGDSIYRLDVPVTDQSGRAMRLSARAGRPQVVSMFYTSCPDVCPLIIDAGRAIERQLSPAERARLGITLLTFDPGRDTPAVLLKTANARHLDLTRWALLQPRAADTRTIAGVLGVRYRQLAGGDFNHNSVLVLLDGRGRVLARSERIGSNPDPAFVAAVRKAAQAP